MQAQLEKLTVLISRQVAPQGQIMSLLLHSVFSAPLHTVALLLPNIAPPTKLLLALLSLVCFVVSYVPRIPAHFSWTIVHVLVPPIQLCIALQRGSGIEREALTVCLLAPCVWATAKWSVARENDFAVFSARLLSGLIAFAFSYSGNGEDCNSSAVFVCMLATSALHSLTAVLLWRNESALRQSSTQARQALASVEQASSSRFQFLTGVNGRILASARRLAEQVNTAELSTLGPEAVSFMNEARAAVLQLASVLEDLHEVLRLATGRVKMKHEHVDLLAVATEAVGLMDAAAASKGVTISVSSSSESESSDSEVGAAPMMAIGDTRRVLQVMLHLVRNAVKFTARGGHVCVAVESELEPALAVVTVTDSGIGISTDAQQHIFEPFFQADGSNTRAFGGLGTGLHISRQLARLMGGDIEAESRLGVGSTFRFSLKLVSPSSASHVMEATVAVATDMPPASPLPSSPSLRHRLRMRMPHSSHL